MAYILIMLAIVFIDQHLKAMASKKIPENTYKELIGDKIYAANVKNKGAAMGFLKGNRGQLMFLSAVSMLFCITYFIRSLKGRNGFLSRLAGALILAGGSSNIYDRLVKKEVTDYIYVKYKKAPVFNIADIAVAVGVILSAIHELKRD